MDHSKLLHQIIKKYNSKESTSTLKILADDILLDKRYQWESLQVNWISYFRGNDVIP